MVDVAPPTPIASLSFRPMTGWEEEWIDQHRHARNTARLCNGVLARCLGAPGQPPSDEAMATIGALWVTDRDRALVQLRQASLGDHVKSEVDCTQCGATNDVSFQLSHLDLGADQRPDPVRVALSDGTEAVLGPLTAGAQADLLELPRDTEAQRRTALLAAVLVQIGQEPGPFGSDRVRSLSVPDRATLAAAAGPLVGGLDLSMGVECASCGASFAVPFDVATFFLPS